MSPSPDIRISPPFYHLKTTTTLPTTPHVTASSPPQNHHLVTTHKTTQNTVTPPLHHHGEQDPITAITRNKNISGGRQHSCSRDCKANLKMNNKDLEQIGTRRRTREREIRLGPPLNPPQPYTLHRSKRKTTRDDEQKRKSSEKNNKTDLVLPKLTTMWPTAIWRRGPRPLSHHHLEVLHFGKVDCILSNSTENIFLERKKS